MDGGETASYSPLFPPARISESAIAILGREWLYGESRYAADYFTRFLFGFVAMTIKEREALVKKLRRFAKDHQNFRRGALALATELELCEPGHRCMSAACPECHRAYKRWFLRACRGLLRSLSLEDHGDLTFITIVPGEKVPIGALDRNGSDVFAVFNEKMIQSLKLAGVTFAVGGIDLSVNEDKHERFQPHYNMHAHLLVKTAEYKTAKPKLDAIYPNSDQVYRSVVGIPYDGKLEALGYMLKRFGMRQSYLQETIVPDGNMVEKPRSRSRPLRGSECLETSLSLHASDFSSLIILLGAAIDTSMSRPTMQLEPEEPDPPEPKMAAGKSRKTGRPSQDR